MMNRSFCSQEHCSTSSSTHLAREEPILGLTTAVPDSVLSPPNVPVDSRNSAGPNCASSSLVPNGRQAPVRISYDVATDGHGDDFFLSNARNTDRFPSRPKRLLCGLTVVMTLPLLILMVLISLSLAVFIIYATTKEVSLLWSSVHDVHLLRTELMYSLYSRSILAVVDTVTPILEQVPLDTKRNAVEILCRLLDVADHQYFLRSVSLASYTDSHMSVCTHGSVAADSLSQLAGTTAMGHTINATYVVDPDSYKLVEPLQVVDTIQTTGNVTTFLERIFRNDTFFEDFMQYHYGSLPTFPVSKYWQRRNRVFNLDICTVPLFLYVTLEDYEERTPSAVGCVFINVKRMRFLHSTFVSSDASFLRIIGLETSSLNDENPIVISNNWDESVVDNPDLWSLAFASKTPTYLSTNNVSDPLMATALRQFDLSKLTLPGTRIRKRFRYDGYIAEALAGHFVTPVGMPVVVIATVSHGAVVGPLYVWVAGFFAGLVAVNVVIIALYAFFVRTMFTRPLRQLASGMANMLAFNDFSQSRILPRERFVNLYEVDQLVHTYNKGMLQLEAAGTFIPHGLLREMQNASDRHRTKFVGESQTLLTASRGLTNTIITIVYVYPLPETYGLRTEPLDRRTLDTLLAVVVELSDRYGGLIEWLRPDMCCIRFSTSIQQLSRSDDATESEKITCAIDDAMSAVSFAKALHCSLVTCDHCILPTYILVDTHEFACGHYHSSALGQTLLVSIGRNIAAVIGYVLPILNVAICLTEECALLVRDKIRVQPIEGLYVGRNDDGRYVLVLYEALEGGTDSVPWQNYSSCFNEGFRCMLQGQYADALNLFDSITDISGVDSGLLLKDLQSGNVQGLEGTQSVQLERLMEECAARIQRNDTGPYVRTPFSADFLRRLQTAPHESNSSHGDQCSSSASLSSGDDCFVILRSPQVMSTHGDGAVAAATVPEISLLGTVSVTDNHGVRWERARLDLTGEPGPIHRQACLGLGPTGTLCVLHSYALRTPCGDLDELNTVLDTLFPETLLSDWTVGMLGYSSRDVGRGIVLVKEYVPGGTMHEMLSRYGRSIPLAVATKYFVCLLRGLRFLHERGHVHGDVRPSNLMVGVEGRGKLQGFFGDYNLARSLFVLPRTSYVSPEVAGGGQPTSASDMFGVGLILLGMLSGRVPWRWSASVSSDRSALQLSELLDEGGVQFEEELCAGNVEVAKLEPYAATSPLGCLCESCLQYDPDRRITAAAALSQLEDESISPSR